MTNPHGIKQRSLCKERRISEVVGNCPFSPELQERKMEYELLELSLVSFSYFCVIFDVIDADASGHIFSLEIAFNIPPRSHSTIILFLLLRNIFRSIPCQTHPAMSFILDMIAYCNLFTVGPRCTFTGRCVCGI